MKHPIPYTTKGFRPFRTMFNLIRSQLKKIVMFLAIYGLISYPLASSIIERGGLGDA